VETRGLALSPKQCWLACSALLLVVAAGCASSSGKRRASAGGDVMDEVGDGKLKLPNKYVAAKHKAAKAAPQSFAPVFAYARAVADVCLASLREKPCETCESDLPRYKRRSELNPLLWPLIEDALTSLDEVTNLPERGSPEMDKLTALKGRLLWLAGRSMEEQELIDGYALPHPDAVAVVRRRLELLRDNGYTEEFESQCTRSRLRMKSASEAALLDLLTACVALHPSNGPGRSDLLDYANYLPNMSTAEDTLYRLNLVQRCVGKVGDEGSRCEQACACVDKESGKPPTAKCKRACNGCRGETAEQVAVCQKLGEAAPAPEPAATSRRKGASRRKSAPAKRAPAGKRKKGVPPGLAPQQAVL
jgi:hypothetical protein